MPKTPRTTKKKREKTPATFEHGGLELSSKPMSEAAADRMEAAAFLFAEIPTKASQLLMLRTLWRQVPRSRRQTHWLKFARRFAPPQLRGLGGAR